MKRIKSFTQRITGLIFYPLIFIVIPFVVAKIGQLFGLWSAIDAQYLMNPLMFWIFLVVSRAVYVTVCILLDMGIHKIGTTNGFFWFAPERESYSSRPDPVDQSGLIVGAVAIFFIFEFIAEFAIRISTMTNAPYRPPPST